ncbi:MAG: hypothetical protein JWO97_3001 [Acidobacteria bacterium]|nr:hypothetical protein [Acidobacteriota bacterium]
MNPRLILTAIFTGSLLAATSFAQPQTFPNSVKYKDSGIRNATGRSGSAAIEARALVNKNGSGDLEVTTGTFDDSSAATGVSKLQLKLATAHTPDTRNYNDVDGANVSIHLDELYRHETFDLQASVRGVDGSRTDVVDAIATAVLRPDLTITNVSAAPHGVVGYPMTVHATIREQNGDVGARANCRLLANGAEVDRAEGIWVDAGGTVDCMFRHPFDDAGDVSLQVAVDAVSPGDWDDANNLSEPVSTHIYGEAQAVYASSVHALMNHDVSTQYSHSAVWDVHSDGDSTTEQLDLTTWVRGPINLLNAKLSTSAQTDGQTIYDYPDVQFPRGFRKPPRSRVTCGSGEAGSARVQLCYNPDANFPEGSTMVEVNYSSSNVFYHSWGYDYSREPVFGPPQYVFDTTTQYNDITQPLGNSVQWDVTLSDGTRLWRDQPFLSSLESRDDRMDRPWSCGFSPRYGEVCSDYHSTSSRREGFLTIFQ